MKQIFKQNIKPMQTRMVVERESNSLTSQSFACRNSGTSKIKKLLIVLCLFIGVGNVTYANNVAVSSVTLTGQNTAFDFTLVQFNISWDNSWRTSVGPSNCDAAWVFVKYRKKTQATWNHATLNWVDGTGSGEGHTEPSNSNIASSNNGAGGAYGVFIHRNADMLQGSVSYSGVQLRWNYGVNGVADYDSVEVCVFAIEMVYVPQDIFVAGSGGTESGAFYTYPTTTNPYTISSEAAITVGTTAGNLYYPNPSTFSGDQTGPIPAAFPKGFNAFYCMKYEITQEQYVEFLNKLTYTQQATRTATAPNSVAGTGALINPNNFRNGIDIMTPGVSTITPAVYACNLDGDAFYNETNDGASIACNYLSWADLAAYLDWTALRPMTELEYEKACRGNQAAVADEYAWVTTIILGATAISNAGLTNETASNAGANAVYNNAAGVQGPMRVGSLGQGVNTRIGVGASYYGIMELSGNNWERPVTAGNATGRAFTGVHGNGVIDATGNANASLWPNTTATGAGFRGGAWRWLGGAVYLRVSDRYDAADTVSGRSPDYAGRGVRSVP
ncbi:MAG: SUMF1/EgtB/PvdO family nonheme iron enzyme [Bacteroidota bacterium]